MTFLKGKQKALLAILLSMAFAPAFSTQVCNSSIPETTPTSRFTINDDGTVTDEKNKLMWKQCLEGVSGTDCSAGEVSELSWESALQAADESTFAGYSNWRLPNIKELESSLEMACSDFTNSSVFPGITAANLWTGSPYYDSVNQAWAVVNGYWGNSLRTSLYGARLVRNAE